ncbi:methyltransferase domain-containing protein [Sphingorhabdus sp.]|uniref:class I SAM-dependent methyltransferase n=1 Tax=Sphingorhabdus sp. TaxID=1902408 RepID=UPI0032B85D37
MRAIDVTSLEGERYLSGEIFSDYGKFVAPIRATFANRIDCLVELVRGKKILHIGFCDHQPLLEERISQGLWLHTHLMRAGTRCVGIDIDKVAVENVSRVTGIADIFVGDVTQPGLDIITGEKWDVVVFGDVIEHIPDPRNFLNRFLEHYGKNISSVVISVPNCQRIGAIKGSITNSEMINSDHTAEYSLFTLAKLANKSGLEGLNFYFSAYANAPVWKRLILRLFPRFSDSLIVTGRVKK